MRTSEHAGVLVLLSVGALSASASCSRDGGSGASGKDASAVASALASTFAYASSLPDVDTGPPRVADGQGDASTRLRLTIEEKSDLYRFRSSVAEGRRATRDKRWLEAETAFTRALAVRPTDARTRAERGYARLLADELNEAREDFERALAGGVDAKLGGQVYFNIGLLREKRKQPDSARAAFAMSNALAPSAAAKGKLGGRSSCTADIDEHPAEGEELHAVADFDALAKEIAPQRDLGSPKASVCVRTHTATGEPEVRDVCSGDPPWFLSHHRQWFTENFYFAVPKKPGPGLLYYETRVGSWPAHCTNLPGATAVMAGEFLHVTRTFDGTMAALDEEHESEDAFMMPCADVLGYAEEILYETRTGNRVFRMYMPNGVPAPKLTVGEGGKASIRGAGCDRTVSLTSH